MHLILRVKDQCSSDETLMFIVLFRNTERSDEKVWLKPRVGLCWMSS